MSGKKSVWNFSFFEKKSIKTKLIGITLIATGVALTLTYLSIILYTLFTFQKNIESQLSSISDIIGNNSTAAIEFDDPIAANEILSALRKDSRIVSGAIYKNNGEIFSRYVSEDGINIYQNIKVEKTGFTTDKKYIHLLKPIVLKDKKIGYLSITADNREIYSKIYSFAGILLLILLISIIPTILLFKKLQETISKPIENLKQTANYVSVNKDYSARADKISQDELGTLVDRFNEMLEQIQQRETQLKIEVEDRKKAELSEKISKDRYQTLFDQSPAGVYIFNKNLKIVQCNKKMADILNTTIDQIVDLNIVDLNDTKFLDSHVDVFKGISNYQEDLYDAKTSNAKLWLAIRFSPIYDNENNIINGMAVVEDITERKNNEELLKNSLKEKETLLKEIHHRVKNNLQIISSILNLQSENVSDSEALSLFYDSQNRINSMALIHERLYRSSEFEYVDFSTYIEDLTNYLINSHHTELSNIRVNLDIEKINLNIDTAVPCGLIVNELMINSVKHAFPNNSDGKIEIKLSENNNGKNYHLSISDNGIGIKDNIDISKSNTLGLQLVYNLAQQLDGDLLIDNSNGTKFDLYFNQVIYKQRH